MTQPKNPGIKNPDITEVVPSDALTPVPASTPSGSHLQKKSHSFKVPNPYVSVKASPASVTGNSNPPPMPSQLEAPVNPNISLGKILEQEKENLEKLLDNTPTHFGRYQIKKELGRGGMGQVYLAYDPNLRRDVALKVAFGNDPELKKRFSKESQTM